MRTISKIPGFALILLIITSCGQKAFPDERFIFSKKYRDLIIPYRVGDTLYFDNENGEVIRIKITGSDSILSNSKGGFMSPRPYKDIEIYCDNLDYHRPNAKDTTLVFINKYPDSLEQSCHFAVMNFRGGINDETDSLISEFRPDTGKLFKNCFVIKNVASDLGEGPHDIEYIYVQKTEGIIALQTYGGNLWIRRQF
jgi:hypothetical protein